MCIRDSRQAGGDVVLAGLCGNEPVQLAAGQGGHFGRQGLAGGDAVQRAVHVVAELRPMGGAGDQHGVFAAQVLGLSLIHI